MVEALSDFQNREAVKGDMKQSADANSFKKIRLRRLGGPPSIPVFVRLDDQNLAPHVRIKAMRDEQPHVISDPANPGWQAKDEWEAQLEIGEYEFVAEHRTSDRTFSLKDTVAPTHIEVPLTVAGWDT